MTIEGVPGSLCADCGAHRYDLETVFLVVQEFDGDGRVIWRSSLHAKHGDKLNAFMCAACYERLLACEADVAREVMTAAAPAENSDQARALRAAEAVALDAQREDEHRAEVRGLLNDWQEEHEVEVGYGPGADLEDRILELLAKAVREEA